MFTLLTNVEASKLTQRICCKKTRSKKKILIKKKQKIAIIFIERSIKIAHKKYSIWRKLR